MPSRCVLLLLDGLGDRYYSELGGTPLQAADTPNLDGLADKGANGLFHASFQGVPLSSPDAHFSLFGYEPAETLPRSVLEAVGAGIRLGPHEVVLLGRLCSGRVENDCLIVVDREPKVDPAELGELAESVGDFEYSGIRFKFRRVYGVTGVLTLEGEVSTLITDTDPQRNGVPLAQSLPRRGGETDATARKTARAVREYLKWVFKRLSDSAVNKTRAALGSPAVNLMATHLPGRLKPVPSFRESWGLRGLSISSKMVQWGLSAAVGFESIRVSQTDDPAADIASRIETAQKELPQFDFVHVHTLAPDQAAHTKIPSAKKEAIEALDRGIGESIAPLLNDPDILLVVASDHSTPSSGPMIHSGESVPLVFVGGGVRRDRVKHFDEVECATGSLGMLRGKEFMHMVLNCLDRAELHGLVYTPDPRPYQQSGYEPFTLKGGLKNTS